MLYTYMISLYVNPRNLHFLRFGLGSPQAHIYLFGRRELGWDRELGGQLLSISGRASFDLAVCSPVLHTKELV
jgi:hypothetical protein